MKAIISIGNPGNKYVKTRHNVGHMLVDYLNSNNLEDYKLLKSDKFMNRSGEFVSKQVNYFNIDADDLYIAHDDLDIKLGEFKITKKSPRDHNGIISINENSNSEDYTKIRIGIDNRNPNNRIPGEDYVLQSFSESELAILEKVFSAIYNEIK